MAIKFKAVGAVMMLLVFPMSILTKIMILIKTMVCKIIAMVMENIVILVVMWSTVITIIVTLTIEALQSRLCNRDSRIETRQKIAG